MSKEKKKEDKEKKKAGRKGKYEEWLTEDGLLIIKGWARSGLTDREMCDKNHLNLCPTTFYEWLRRFPQLLNAIKEGRNPVEVTVEDTFINEKLTGRFVEEEVTEITRYDDGREIKHIRKTKRWKDADTTALIFFLKCRLSSRYNDRINLTIEDKGNGQLAKLIDGLRENDIHTETETANEFMAEEQAKTN